MSYVTDSGVSYRSDENVLYHHSRHLYLPFIRPGISSRLSGCMLKRCKFPTITCNKCAFDF